MYEIEDEISCVMRSGIMRFYRDERPQSRYNCNTSAEIRSEALSSVDPQAYPMTKKTN